MTYFYFFFVESKSKHKHIQRHTRLVNRITWCTHIYSSIEDLHGMILNEMGGFSSSLVKCHSVFVEHRTGLVAYGCHFFSNMTMVPANRHYDVTGKTLSELYIVLFKKYGKEMKKRTINQKLIYVMKTNTYSKQVTGDA